MPNKPKLILKSPDIGTWSLDILTNSMAWDDYSHSLFGLGAGALPTRYEDFLGLLSPDDQERVAHEIPESIEKGAPYETEFSVIWPDGSVHGLGARGTVYRDEADRPVRMMGVYWDITERKRAEDRHNELTSIVEASDDAIIWTTLEGIIIRWNQGAERVYGYLASEVIGKPLSILLPPDNPDELPGIMERLQRGESIDHYETVRRGKDGRMIDVALTISPIREPLGRITAASSRTWDITELKRADEALKLSDTRYRRLFETAQDGILILSETGIINDVNPYLLEMLGYSKAQVVGTHLCDIGFVTDRDLCQKTFRFLQESGYVRYDGLPLETQSGKRLEVEFVSNVYLAGGEKVIQCNIRDITEHRRVKETVKVSETRYRRLFEAAQDGILILSETGIIADANAYLLEMLECSKDQLVGKHLCDLGFLVDRDLCQKSFRSLQESGYVRHDGLPLETQSGKRLEVEFVSNVYLAGGEKVIQCNIRDISEHRRVQTALKLSEIRYRRLFETAQDGILILSETGIITDVNPYLLKMLGYSKAQLLGKHLCDLGFMVDHDLCQKNFRSLQQSGYVRYDGLPLETCSKNRLEVEFVSNLYAAGGEKVIQCNIRDITKQRRSEAKIHQLNEGLEKRVRERTAELAATNKELGEKNIELERAMVTKDRFLASMSHELRTPLNAILGFAGTLLMKLPGPLTDEQSKQLLTIRSSGQHLLSLINDLLDLAKIESGKISLSIEPVVFQRVVDEVCSALGPVAEEKGLELKPAVPEAQLVLDTDRRALSQIVINLVNNAIKFTERGEVGVVLHRQTDKGKSWIQIGVHDTGIGIRPEDQPKLFQAFSQLDRNPRRNEGAGLGLQLSQRLAELLGGEISFKSEYGKGSTFTLSLPES